MARKVKLVSWGRTVVGVEYQGFTTAGDELRVSRHPRTTGWLCRMTDNWKWGSAGELIHTDTLAEMRDRLDAGDADRLVRELRITLSKPIQLSDMLAVAEASKAPEATLFVAGMCFRTNVEKFAVQVSLCEEKPQFEVVFDTDTHLFVNIYTGDPK